MVYQTGDLLRPHYIQLGNHEASAEGYVVAGAAEQVRNWLEQRHFIFDAGISAKLGAFSALAFLNNINVDESLRGEGYGTHLLTTFINLAASHRARAIVLLADTAESQAPGFDLVEWYQSRDFETVLQTESGPLMILEF